MTIKHLFKSIILISALTSIAAITSCVDPGATTNADGATVSKLIPTAKPVLDEKGQPRKDLFISPYKPYNPIDTKGFKSGEIVGDPSTASIGEKSGKPVLSTSKTFRIP